MGREPLTLKSIQVAMEELYPNRARALTLTQHSLMPSPRLRSRLYGKALKVGENEMAKNCGEAPGGKLTSRPQGKIPMEVATEDKPRVQKKWGRSRREPEAGSKPPREAKAEERPTGGDKLPGVEHQKTSGDTVRCEKCKKERELQQNLHKERLSLGTSELDLGRCRRYDVEKLARTRSCRRSPEVGEDTQNGGGHQSNVRDAIQEPRRPGKNLDKKEDRDMEEQESHAPGAARALKDAGEASVGLGEGSREVKRDSRLTCRTKQGGGWLLREHQANPEERKAGASTGRKTILRDEPPARVEKESKMRPEESKAERPAGRKPRPTGILTVSVEKHYETGRVVGDGNFAVVKECRHRETRLAYAMKIIDKSRLKGKEDMVDSEIAIVRSLSHPNIVKLHEVYETEKEVYLILEYVQGGDLFDAIIESVKFPESVAALMIKDLSRALVHMHGKGIVHRDLKPENLLVQRNEDKSTTLKLADFGLAKHVVRPLFTVCGTPTYVAPEILSEKGYGLEVDMWAAGVILYILLCGFPPFRSPERDQEELFNIIQLGHFEFLAPYWDSISDAAKDLVSRLLVVDPKKRYTAHQVLQHPWIEAAGKSTADLPEEASPSSEGLGRSQHKRIAEHTS
ncbi:serine/threonine-protein kinase DCLK3 [Ochotona curzoniae]|uniref:serine/threonine-protein kinase DCLK3 n=1 Tax=Ochotona curzoniae TaxID=130825 RepID=UPI001B34ACCB|nr:serine/threonine-protein kinase DCLK3 [Ochotona curzoniae]